MTKTARILTSALLILLTGALYFTNAFGSIENYYEDLIYQHGHAVPGDIKIIAIDNKTLDSIKKGNNITLLTLEKICTILDCTPNDVVRFLPNP